MFTADVLVGLKGNPFTRQELFASAVRRDACFQETQIRYLMGKLLESGQVIRTGRNLYEVSSGGKQEYRNRYSEKAKQIAEVMERRFPHLEYRIWELCWLNEFFNHQIARNKIFVEVENDGCEYVFEELEKEFGSVLLKPSGSELYLYGKDEGIIVDRLIKEAPKGGRERYGVPLEKIIVDLFANKLLNAMLSKGDYPLALTEMFEEYRINQSKLFRYARRRNKEAQIREYISTHTNIRLL